MSLDVKGEACGNDFHESMQVNVSQCKSMYDGQDIDSRPVYRLLCFPDRFKFGHSKLARDLHRGLCPNEIDLDRCLVPNLGPTE